MKQLFGEDSGEVTLKTRRYSNKTPIEVSDIESSGMGDILRRGFKLSRSEWDVILHLVNKNSPKTTLDSLKMGRIFRVSSILRMLWWNLLEGIALIQTVDVGLLTTLATSNQGDLVLSTIDKLIWMSRWMIEFDLTVRDIINIVKDPEELTLFPNQDVINWVTTLQNSMQTVLAVPSDFAPYTTWTNGTDTNTITINENDWMEQLRSACVIDDYGLVYCEEDFIPTAVDQILSANGVNLTQNEEGRDSVDSMLRGKLSQQHEALGNQIVKLANSLHQASVPYLLQWMKMSYYDVEKMFLAWDTVQNPVNEDGLRFIFDLRRHLLVIDKFSMSNVEIQICTTPSVIADDMAIPISLEQVYILSRFKTLQNTRVSANDWAAYFSLAQNQQSNAKAQGLTPTNTYKALALLLDFPPDDIGKLATGTDIGINDGWILNIQQADYVSRRISLCKDLCISASDLISLESANSDKPDWSAASAAANLALSCFKDGCYVSSARGNVDEEARDALVGTYMYAVVAKDSELTTVIKTDDVLYQYLLIDVEVSDQVPTTRLLENVGAIQLYINRILSGVEKGNISDRDKLVTLWKTAQQYRVWQAQEELDLYPCNYVEPELRSNKTALFLQLEQDLTQGDLTDSTVDTALRKYLSSVQDLTRLLPKPAFSTFRTSTTRVFITAPSSTGNDCYYRSVEIAQDDTDFGPIKPVEWGEWTKANLPISSETVFGFVPAFAWNRLFFFWLELQKEPSYTTGDSNNAATKTWNYSLVPKCSQRNLDGSFSQPLSPTNNSGLSLDLGTDVDETKLDPLIYIPFYDENADVVTVAFSTVNREKADKDSKYFAWKVSYPNLVNELVDGKDEKFDYEGAASNYNVDGYDHNDPVFDLWNIFTTVPKKTSWTYGSQYLIKQFESDTTLSLRFTDDNPFSVDLSVENKNDGAYFTFTFNCDAVFTPSDIGTSGDEKLTTLTKMALGLFDHRGDWNVKDGPSFDAQDLNENSTCTLPLDGYVFKSDICSTDSVVNLELYLYADPGDVKFKYNMLKADLSNYREYFDRLYYCDKPQK